MTKRSMFLLLFFLSIQGVHFSKENTIHSSIGFLSAHATELSEEEHKAFALGVKHTLSKCLIKAEANIGLSDKKSILVSENCDFNQFHLPAYFYSDTIQGRIEVNGEYYTFYVNRDERNAAISVRFSNETKNYSYFSSSPTPWTSKYQVYESLAGLFQVQLDPQKITHFKREKLLFNQFALDDSPTREKKELSAELKEGIKEVIERCVALADGENLTEPNGDFGNIRFQIQYQNDDCKNEIGIFPHPSTHSYDQAKLIEGFVVVKGIRYSLLSFYHMENYYRAVTRIDKLSIYDSNQSLIANYPHVIRKEGNYTDNLIMNAATVTDAKIHTLIK